MRRIALLFLSIITVFGIFYFKSPDIQSYGDDEFVEPSLNLSPLENYANMRFPGLFNWERPEGPAKVALQIGHLNVEDHPEELANLRNNTGSQGGGFTEAEVNAQIAGLAKDLLEEKDILVELLPATVPPGYWADVFLAIHADGSEDRSSTGYKVARTYRDMSGTADILVDLLEKEYEKATGFLKDENITRNMRGYYAFRWWRYNHAVHPMTTAAIIETGFLTSPQDRKIIVDQPEISAQAIADAIIKYLENEELI